MQKDATHPLESPETDPKVCASIAVGNELCKSPFRRAYACSISVCWITTIKFRAGEHGEKIMSVRINFLLTTSLATAFCAHTATAATTLDDILVTATRTAQSISNVTGAVTVITREQIEQRQAQSLPELLRHETGMDITSQGGFGKLSAMFIRGTEPEHVLVLIDGVRVGSITAGTNPFEYLPVDQIERIEIVRGPRSSLYGSDAIGGVIQIFTRGGKNQTDRASISVGGGSDNTWKTNGDFSLRFGDSWLGASGSYFATDGINACKGSLSGGCFTVEPDDDGFINRSGSLRAGHSFGERADIEFSSLYATGYTEFDGSFQNQTRFREWAPSLRAHVQASKAWNLKFNAGFSRDDQDNFLHGTFRSFFDSERRSASLQSDYTIGKDHLVTVGYDYLDDQVASTTLFDVKSRENKGVFAQYQIALAAHRLTASGRRDDNEQFGSHATGNLGWKWLPSERYSVFAAWGSAFRAPSFNDLYFPGFSNPNLEPEQSRSYEIGVDAKAGVWRGSVNVYKNEIDDLIELDGSFRPANIANAEIVGIEIINSVALDAWDFALNYSYTDPRNRVPGANFDKILLRRARQSVSLTISHRWNRLDLGLLARAQGRRFNNPANTTELPGYATADIVAGFSITDEWKIEAKVTNVFDKDYETVRFYSEAPRSYFASVVYKPTLR
jgi:vitamin B12 transporter